MTRLLILCLFALLPACAPRGVLSVLPLPAGALDAAQVQTVYVATNRRLAPGAEGRVFEQDFGERRSAVTRYARFDISIPPLHQVGQIEWPGLSRPDPARHFVTTGTRLFDTGAGFLRDVKAAQPERGGEVLLFVHGYNNNNAEVAYRLAQIAHDFEARVPVIAYSWPSAGSPRGYVYDRDSVMFSRDGLEQLLRDLTLRGGHRVLIVAHSMGSQLVMETLRQMSISGGQPVLSRLSGVALISPDIDEDVFVGQAQRITPFPQPFMILASSRDRILNVSAWLTGTPTRLGSIDKKADLGDLPVEIVDLSGIPGGDRVGHATAFTAPAAIQLLRSLSGR